MSCDYPWRCVFCGWLNSGAERRYCENCGRRD